MYKLVANEHDDNERVHAVRAYFRILLIKNNFLQGSLPYTFQYDYNVVTPTILLVVYLIKFSGHLRRTSPRVRIELDASFIKRAS